MTAVDVKAGTTLLGGRLALPDGAPGVVLLAHSGANGRNSRHSRFLAAILHEAVFGTLLLDLLTPEEEFERAKVFDIALLADRLADATHWLRQQPATQDLPVGYFGASTAAAAALWAATDRDLEVGAVVSFGGRPDLAQSRLAAVQAPTLFIVGGEDDLVFELNLDAQAGLRCVTHLAVVHGASHLFEEKGTLREAAELARDWFFTYLVAAPHLAGLR